MPEELWARVDEYFGSHFAESDAELLSVLETNASAGLPPIDVSRPLAKFLHLLVRIHGAKRILEVGTLGGYSTIWLARALPAEGSLVTLEINPKHADVARQNFARTGVSSRVEIMVGDARESLAKLDADGVQPFDFVFIDADKASNAEYFKWALRLVTDGAVIVIDNVVRNGDVIDSSSDDENVLGVRALVDALHHEPTVEVTALQTVGTKGYDGFIMAVVDRNRQTRSA